jgi:hypothetical protein
VALTGLAPRRSAPAIRVLTWHCVVSDAADPSSLITVPIGPLPSGAPQYRCVSGGVTACTDQGGDKAGDGNGQGDCKDND